MQKFSHVFKILSTFIWASSALAQNSNEIEASRQQIQNALSGNSSIVIASRKTETEVVNFVDAFYKETGWSEADVSFTIFLSDNGWFGISVGDTPANQCDQTVRNLVSQALIPDDSYCTNAQSYIAAFEVRNNALNPLIGRNYFVEGSVSNAQAQSASDDVKLNFDIFFNNQRAFEIFQKLDGSLSVSGIRSNSEYSVCIYLDAASNESIDEGFSLIVEKAVEEVIGEAGFDMKGSIPVFKRVCRLDTYTDQITGIYSDIAVIFRPSVPLLNESGWTRVGEIPDEQIRTVASSLEKEAQEAAEKLEALQNEYLKLAEDASYLKLGSVNLAYPGERERTQICTKSINGDAAIPFIRYLTYRNGGAFSEGFLEAATKSYSGSNFFNNGYALAYNDLDEFFVDWQKSEGGNCDVWVDYPAEIIKFLEAATRVYPDMSYEFNDLVPVSELFDAAAKEQGFSDWNQRQFAKAISATGDQLRQLKQFDIVSGDAWDILIEEIRESGYASSVRPTVALEYLRDRKSAQSSDKTALDIRNERQEREAAERKRREEARRAREAEEARKRAENIKKGEGTFTYYSDGTCTEEKDRYCVSKEEFKGICEKVRYRTTSSGYVDIYSLALVMMPRNLRDLYRNDRSSVSSPDTYVTVNDDCYFTFNISGSVNGTSINKPVYCRVTGIEGRSGAFYTESVTGCFTR
jgi:hypothetical protein